ncbi:MAG: glycosyltransferase family 2 protein [Nitrospirae bacterium]|nr:glycosyltransferase family 2 protein [Nitrospirota bacterium]
MTKVSVVIPCYNHASYLPEAVASVVAQTFRDFEIIIVNDGSPDDTADVAGALVEKHPDVRIRLLNKKNGGLPAARNSGIEAAAGEYILPLDADDVILPDTLMETVRVLDENPAVGVAYPRMGLFGELPEGADRSVTYLTPYDFGRLAAGNHVPVCSLFRKKAWKEVGGYKVMKAKGFEDWEFWITLGEAGWYGMPAEKALFMYRVKAASMFTDAVKVRPRICHEIRGLHPRLYYPRTSKAGPAVTRAVNFAAYVLHWSLDSVSHYLYRNHEGLHTALRSVFGGLLRPFRHEPWR